jgi:DNA-binding NtrC family response regulator
MEVKQPWVTCLLTDILLTHVAETAGGIHRINFPGLFKGLEGFEPPAQPETFLREAHNWVPLQVLRALGAQCQSLTGDRDFAYHAARAYFDPAKEELPSLFRILIRVLHDVRSVLICSNLFGASQTNYLRAQPFERPGTATELFVLAQFEDIARPTAGAISFLRGIFEGFPRLLPALGEVRCTEEISQLSIAEIVRGFPEFQVAGQGDEIAILHAASKRPAVTAKRIPLREESLPLTPGFRLDTPDAAVVLPRGERIQVLTDAEETDAARRPTATTAYTIVQPGTVTAENLSYTFDAGRVYDAPYSRFRFTWTGSPVADSRLSVEDLRREISHLLFDYLRQMKVAHTRVAQDHIEKRSLRLENIQLRRAIGQEYGFAGIVGRSPKMQALFTVIRSLAETDVTALIQGETGTGKELIARAIHYHSPRREHRFVAINCGALSETLLESELFGHERGAFTGAIAQRKGIFEAADGGTLFLDEIGEVPPSTQVKLLRVLQEGEFQRVGGSGTMRVDVRIVAATNQNVDELVKGGRLRQDLYYRLNVFPIKVPALRERREDIPLLAAHFLEKRRPRPGRQITGVSPAAMAALMAHSWPGNVRELENAIQRMMVVAKGEILDAQDLPEELRGAGPGPKEAPGSLKGIARESAGIVEKQAILDALAKTGGNITRAARALGVSRATLQNKMKAYGLRPPERAGAPPDRTPASGT